MKAEQDMEKQLAGAQAAWEDSPAPALWDRLEERLDAALPAAAPRKPRNWPFRIVMMLLPVGLVLGWALWPTAANPGLAQQLEERNAAVEFHAVAYAAGAASGSGHPSEVGAKLEMLVNEQITNTATYDLNFSLPAGNMLVTNGYGNPIDTVRSLQQYSNGYLGADNNRYLQINPARNDLNFNFAGAPGPHSQQDLQHLKWLLGSWKKQGASGGTMEEWRQMDAFTLVGRGYFVVNGDTMVTQEMRIEQRGPNIYYIIAKDEDAKAMKFRLRSRTGHELVFQDETSRKIITTTGDNSSNGPPGNTSKDAGSPPVYQVLKRK
jgi:hypothetical protein